MKKWIKGIHKYLQDLVDRNNCTSMSRFLSLNVVMSVLIAWSFNSIWMGYMVNIPESVLTFVGIVIGGRTVQGVADALGIFRNKDGNCSE
jgi:hypothetical protein